MRVTKKGVNLFMHVNAVMHTIDETHMPMLTHDKIEEKERKIEKQATKESKPVVDGM